MTGRRENPAKLADDVVEAARGGDEAALRRLYDEHQHRVLRLAFGILGDTDEAEDVLQDTMVYALTHLNRYDPDRAAFSTWLHTIALSRCRDRLRRRRSYLDRVAEWLRHEQSGYETDLAGGLRHLDTKTEVGRALEELTPKQREAVVLREIEGLTYREIGDVLGVPLRTAQARVVSGYSALRRALTEAGESPADTSGAGK